MLHLPVRVLMPDPQSKRVRLAEQLARPHWTAQPLDAEAMRDR